MRHGVHFDNHELPHPAKVWTTYAEGTHCRNVLQVRNIPRTVHDMAHLACGGVVMPYFDTLSWVARRLEDRGRIDRNVDEYEKLVEQFESTHAEQLKPLDVDVNHLGIAGLRAQLPVIMDGMRTRTYIDLGRQ